MNNNNVNIFVAAILSILIIIGWQYFYERPRVAKLAIQHSEYQKKIIDLKDVQIEESRESDAIIDKNEAIQNSERVYFSNSAIEGSISLRGARIDDLRLKRYKQTIEKESSIVELLSPNNTREAYFVELGWLSKDNKDEVPDSNSIWQSDKKAIKEYEDVNLYWTNKSGVKFILTIKLDNDYIFHISQSIENNTHNRIALQNYGLINKNLPDKPQSYSILHEGPIGYIDGKLEEINFEKIKDERKKTFQHSNVGWIGITDKYWLVSFIPDNNIDYKSNFSYAIKNAIDKFQIDFIGKSETIEPGSVYSLNHKLFAGAKQLSLLEKYEKEYNISLFDRAVDFGWLYIITKPLFYILDFFHKYTGNFGISILIVTVILKLAMFGFANKSFRSMKKMKDLQPEIEHIKNLWGEDKAKYNQELMSLYKRQKVNPLSGCLPMIIQIPIFFAIYKVLYVTIEMRHAPFFGWIHDLSAPDPTNIFNLFGLLKFIPMSFLHLGAWPIFMVITMFLQQRMSPPPSDPTQAVVMKFMPLMFLFMFGGFPAGLLIYWTWSNLLSIVQQYYINKLDRNN
jgi:YidC/Oxa1 family membrane protein insertase